MHLLLSLIYNLTTSFLLLKLSEATQCQSNDFAPGRFVRETIAIANLTTDTATTFTYPVTVTEPVWHCTSGCPDEGYGIIASPYDDVTMGQGIISPPAGYAVLTIGSDGLPSPGPCTIGVPKPSLTHSHRTWPPVVPRPSLTGQSTLMTTYPISHSISGSGSHPYSSGPHPSFSTASSSPTGGHQGSSSAASSSFPPTNGSSTSGSGTSWPTRSSQSPTVDGPHESNPSHTSPTNSSPKTSTTRSTSKTSNSNDPSDSLPGTSEVSNEPTDSSSTNDSSHTTESSSSLSGAAPAPTPVGPPVGITTPVAVLITESLADGATTITEVLGPSNGGSSLSTTTAAEPMTTLDPGGSEASSNAVVLLGHLSKLHDPLDKYISSSNMPAVQTSAITAIVSAGHVADKLKNLLPDDTNGGGACSSGGLNLFKSIGNAVSCAVNSIKDITGSISGSVPNVDLIKSQLSNLDNIVSESENDKDEDDNDDSTTATKDHSSTKTDDLTTTTDLSTSTEDSSSTCSATEPVSSCNEACTVLETGISSSLTTICTSSCFTTGGCTASATTVESTTTESSPAITPIVIQEPAELVLDLLEGVPLSPSASSSVSTTDESSISTSASTTVITPIVIQEPAELVLDLLEGVTLSSSHGSTTSSSDTFTTNPSTTAASTTTSTHTSHTSQTHPPTTFTSSYTTSTSSTTTTTTSFPSFPVVCFPRLGRAQCQCNGTDLYATPMNSDGSCPQPTGKTLPSYSPQECYIRDWTFWNYLKYLKCEANAE